MRFALRLGRPSDLAYVVDSWVKRGRPPRERIGAATARVRAILAHPDSVLRVACLPDDLDAILGWAVIDTTQATPRAHYAYVRKDARGKGIARAMLECFPDDLVAILGWAVIDTALATPRTHCALLAGVEGRTDGLA